MPELIWDGKYDKDGKRVAPLRVALPFQTVETVNESKADREKALDLFARGQQTEWRNRLIWGDKKYVLPSLLPEFAGKVNLIYIDPPFATGADFSFTARIPDNPETDEDESAQFTKRPSMIEHKAYRDTWGKGLDSYLKWFYETAIFLRELLAEDGSIYVHCDWHAGHYIKIIMDKLFGFSEQSGRPGFKNDIIWHYFMGGKSPNMFGRKHDLIFLYTKSEKWTFNKMKHKRRLDYVPGLPAKSSSGKEIKDTTGKDKVGWYSIVSIDDVWDISGVFNMSNEYLAYDTQKPEALLERIIKASSNEGDLVLDCFVGSGTTAAVAEKLGRRWIAADLSRFAIHTTRKRLLGIENLKPFVIQNLGKYERQVWQSSEFGESNAQRQLRYRRFILELYHSRPLEGYLWLHGMKSGRFVHVGSVDSPVTESDIASIAAEFKKSMGSGKDAPKTNGVDILGWDFAFEVNELSRTKAELAGLDIKLKKIPMDVMDKKAVEQGDIYFFELAALDVKTKVKGKKLTVEIENFIIPQDDIPDEVRGKITHWSQWLDYWAIDWDYRDDTFHNQWQSYRTRKENKLITKTAHTYDEPGKYALLIKVVDILGNDTTKMVEVEVG